MDDSEAKCVFETRPVQFFGRTVQIVMQSVNGPCPLIAICNVLSLRGDIEISQDMDEVTLDALINLVETWLSNPNRNTGGFLLTKQPKDISKVLKRFANFVYFDVGFLNIHDFVFTLEMAIFKFLNIELVHGWLVEGEAATIVGDSSHDDLQYRAMVLRAGSENANLINEKGKESGNSPDFEPDSSVSRTDDASLGKKQGQEKELITDFVEGRQITYKGLFTLHDLLQEQKLYILYRENHFSTLFKYKKALYMLVTAISYKDKPDIVWEKLCEVDGNSKHYTSDFTEVVTGSSEYYTATAGSTEALNLFMNFL